MGGEKADDRRVMHHVRLSLPERISAKVRPPTNASNTVDMDMRRYYYKAIRHDRFLSR